MTLALKTDPKYGYYPWWPEDESPSGNDWIHPEDVELARSVIPSPRVWRRDGRQGDYVVLTYGKLLLRLQQLMWRELRWEGFDIGNLVEVRPQGMKHYHRTGVIREMLWDETTETIQYQLQELDEEIENPQSYSAEDLKHVEPPVARPDVRVEPPTEEGEEYEVEKLPDDA
ncbi:DUF6960 family protein [Aeoliella sp. SH292]|uniref:DUF6960 family protein n=1 Tax=Aeoliella sp. SH292 TaxID=3454464 RepID=UPI003F954D12